MIVDDSKIEEEELNARLKRKEPGNSETIRLGQELIEAAFNGDQMKVK